MKKEIFWGVMGCGYIATKFVKALMTCQGSRLHAVASTSAERAKTFADTYQVKIWYDNYEALVNDQEIDIIYIANTNNFHYESIKLCLNNHKAVLCEKPFAINAKQAGEVIHLARTKDVFLMEGMWSRFLPALKKVRETILKGEIGEIQSLTGSFEVKSNTGLEGRHLNNKLGGGALLDVGIYPISIASYLLNEMPLRVIGDAEIGPTGVDETSSYTIDFPHGITAVLKSSIVKEGSKEFQITGTKGQIVIPTFWRAESFTLTNNNGEQITHTFKHPCNGFEYEIVAVANYLKEGKKESDLCPLDETLEVYKHFDDLRSSWGMKYQADLD
jgi:dihydrodiol dehydrogenase / D-xylose 1-dehydrogenase (NADP)